MSKGERNSKTNLVSVKANSIPQFEDEISDRRRKGTNSFVLKICSPQYQRGRLLALLIVCFH